MATTATTTEPKELRAGDTWQWRREDLADYPAPVWTLTYFFRAASAHFDVVAAADGVAHSVNVVKATTASRTAGQYDVVAVVESATERHEVGRFSIKVLPDFSAASNLDGRTFAKRLLDAVEAALENRASKDQLDVVEATLADRGMKRTPGGMMALRSQLKSEVRREESAAGIAAGKPSRNRVMVRFSHV